MGSSTKYIRSVFVPEMLWYLCFWIERTKFVRNLNHKPTRTWAFENLHPHSLPRKMNVQNRNPQLPWFEHSQNLYLFTENIKRGNPFILIKSTVCSSIYLNLNNNVTVHICQQHRVQNRDNAISVRCVRRINMGYDKPISWYNFILSIVNETGWM